MSNQDWNNRIVRYGTENPGQLLANEWNWRIHPKAQQDALKSALDEIGWVQDVIINLRTSDEWGDSQGVETIVDGHARVKLALRHDQDSIPVKYVDLSPTQELQALASLDPIGAMAAQDDKLLAEVVKSITDDGGIIPGMADSEIDRLLSQILDEQPEPAEAQVDKAEELNEIWQVKVGDVWELPTRNGNGMHRVVCGDCRKPEVVKLLFGDELMRLFVTDPPYGVGYADKNEFLNKYGKGNTVQTPIESDHVTIEDLSAILLSAFSNAIDASENGCPFYIFSPPSGNLMMMTMITQAGWDLRHGLAWVKNTHVLSRSDYQYKHESILYGWKSGGAHWFYGDRSQFSVWEFNKPHSSKLHPTMKPVELVEKAVTNSSKHGDIVGDFFLGSGTTLIACENLSRLCRGIEIHPPYTAVILQRYLDTFGIQPVKVG